MNPNIVKIRKPEQKLYGTGIVISRDLVITAMHVVADVDCVDVEYYENTFLGNIFFTDNNIALIKIDNPAFSKLFDDNEAYNLYFTNQEIISNEQEWEIQGFLSAEQIPHSIVGKGLFEISIAKESCDYEVRNITVGKTNNYEGLSGSPVICNGRAVGIVQIQKLDLQGELGIGFSSIKLFETNVPPISLRESGFITKLKSAGKIISLGEIEKNKASAKYIPEIFVEEGNYKEYLRFFCDPVLFIQKAIEDLQNINLQGINQCLDGNVIEFTSFAGPITSLNFNEKCESLYEALDKSIEIINRFDPEHTMHAEYSIEERHKRRSEFNYSIVRRMKEILRELEFIKKRMLLLTKKAGQGKTNFLCNLTECFLVRKGLPTFYYNASSFIEKPSNYIINQLTFSGKWSVEYVKSALGRLWETSGECVVIVIDGLNENTTLCNFGHYIDESMKSLMQIPYLKVVMTTRKELFDERFPTLNSENLGQLFYHLDMTQRHDEIFNDRIFSGYLKFFNVQILPTTLSDKTYRQLSEDPLLLRFFCEVNRGKKQVYMYDIYKYALFSRYYEMKKNELNEKQIPGGGVLFDKLITSIMGYMLQNKCFSHIPKKELSIEEIQLLNQLLETDVIFKEDSVIKQGYVEESIETLSFTFDEFRDYCLTSYLVRLPDAAQRFPEIWEKMHEESWSVVEGVERFIFFLARTTLPQILPVIEKGTTYSSIYWENVWNLEDNDITDDDIGKWKQHLLENGVYSPKIVQYLLTRMDRAYFKKASVDLLFEFFNDLAKVPSQYDCMLRTFFPIKEVDRYGLLIRKNGRVAYCDKIVSIINKQLDSTAEKSVNKDCLKLTVYFQHVLPREINNLWIKAFRKKPDLVKGILKELSNIDDTAVFVKQNTITVVKKLHSRFQDQSLNELLNIIKEPIDLQNIENILGGLWG